MFGSRLVPYTACYLQTLFCLNADAERGKKTVRADRLHNEQQVNSISFHVECSLSQHELRCHNLDLAFDMNTVFFELVGSKRKCAATPHRETSRAFVIGLQSLEMAGAFK